jgi:hypothetical protein
MPWSIGDVPFTTVSPTGTVNYTDGMSKFAMNDAPFGGYLGFRHGASSTIPNTAIKSYRWQYRRTGASVWTDFSEPVVVYYILEAPGALPALVPYKLGPNPIKGMNLYDFRPDASSLPKPISGSQTTWVSTGIMNTEFSGFWQSATKDLPADIYEIRLTVYSPTGVQVVPSAAFNFVLPILPAVNGVINTRLATASEMVDSGYRVKVNIDNRVCSGDIVPPKIGSTGADDCGMLRYAPTDTSKTQIGFSASQPGNHAVFKFSMIRGITSVPSTDVQSAEVSAAAAGVYVKNSTGYYNHGFTVTDLLGPCSSGGDAAFSENLNVYAKATTGNSYRIGAYDFSFVRAYALSKK